MSPATPRARPGRWWRRSSGVGPATTAGEGPQERVVLYGRTGCHLCAQAREVVAEVTARTREAFREVDVDAPAEGEEAGDAPGALATRYGELVPVVLVDGEQHAVYHVDAARLEAALRRGPRRGGRRVRP
ncbi:glutaredoxin family protein [Pseudokineococcus sp. 1T1Z-3]|uniref:glutaredoxin family protein n=1 Tax=Pseudokineococcus sp. 1T1Z-3 TaxID=3132745 RepID=UPI0030B14B82